MKHLKKHHPVPGFGKFGKLKTICAMGLCSGRKKKQVINTNTRNAEGDVGYCEENQKGKTVLLKTHKDIVMELRQEDE